MLYVPVMNTMQSLCRTANLTEVLTIVERSVQAMIEDWRYQARVQPLVYGLLVALYACMIIVGATGNLLVILVVVRNRAMRTARNVYIVNLAISDLMLCLITMPLTLIEILYMTWQVHTIQINFLHLLNGRKLPQRGHWKNCFLTKIFPS